MILSEKSATFRDHAVFARMILSEKSATFRDHAVFGRVTLSEKSATFRDHAVFARMISLPMRRDEAPSGNAAPPTQHVSAEAGGLRRGVLRPARDRGSGHELSANDHPAGR